MAQEMTQEIKPCLPTAGQALVTAAKAEISGSLAAAETKSSKFGYTGLKHGEKCEELFHHGIDLNSLTDLADRCGPYAQATKLFTPFLLLENDKSLPPFKAQPGWVLIYRPIDHELGPENGFFKIIGSSAERPLQPNEIMALDGDVPIEYPKAGGGYGLLMAIAKI